MKGIKANELTVTPETGKKYPASEAIIVTATYTSDVAVDSVSFSITGLSNGSSSKFRVTYSDDKKTATGVAKITPKKTNNFAAGGLNYTVNALPTITGTPSASEIADVALTLVSVSGLDENQLIDLYPALLGNAVNVGGVWLGVDEIPSNQIYSLFRMRYWDASNNAAADYGHILISPARHEVLRVFATTSGDKPPAVKDELPVYVDGFGLYLPIKFDDKGECFIRTYLTNALTENGWVFSVKSPTYLNTGNLESKRTFWILEFDKVPSELKEPSILEDNSGLIHYTDGSLYFHGMVPDYNDREDTDDILLNTCQYGTGHTPQFLTPVKASDYFIGKYNVNIPYSALAPKVHYNFSYVSYDGTNFSKSLNCLFVYDGPDFQEGNPPDVNYVFPAPVLVWVDNTTNKPHTVGVDDDCDLHVISNGMLSGGVFTLKVFFENDYGLVAGDELFTTIHVNAWDDNKNRVHQDLSVSYILTDADITAGSAIVPVDSVNFYGFDSSETDLGHVWLLTQFAKRDLYNHVRWVDIDTVSPGM